MAGEFISSRGLSVSRGGSGEPLVVLLHGLGANRAVWQRMIEVVGKHWPGRWMAPDLRGHGLSSRDGPYGYAMHAADIAELIADEPGGNVTLAGGNSTASNTYFAGFGQDQISGGPGNDAFFAMLYRSNHQ